eukprot:PITA_32011
MEYAVSASRGAIAGCLRNDVAVSWGRLSLSSNRQIASRFEFSDESHLQYYGGMVKPYCGKKNKSEKLKLKHLSPVNDRPSSDKRRLNLLEFISKDLPALATTPADASASLTEQVRAEILSDAVNEIMRQLEQAKAERKERKRQLKAQKKALKLAEKQRKSKGRCEDSSSSSSDRETEVVDMTRIRSTQQVDRILEASDQTPSVSIENPPAEVKGDEKALHVEFAEASDRLGLNSGLSIPVQESNSVIKVCMGGKCKKSGSEMLLGTFEERLSKSGFEVEAVGCKCMGKCRNAPNVRVQTEDDSGKGRLHMGFNIGDIDQILSQYFGLNLQQPPSLKEGQIATGLVPT